MGQQYMKCLRVSQTSDKGFTILEMMVGISMTLAVSGIALAALSNAERGFTKDKGKVEGGQKLSSVIDTIGREIVQAGEEINDPRFPVIKVTPDIDPNPLTNKGSRIIIYRGLEEALSLCSALPSTNALATGATTTTLSLTSTNSGVQLENSSCIPPATPTTPAYPSNVQDWIAKRTASNNPTPGQSTFFLHDGQGNIQRLLLTGETKTSASGLDTIGLTVSSNPTTPTAITSLFNFPNRSTLNLVEKREYLICSNAGVNELKVRINNPNEGSCATTGTSLGVSLTDSATSPFKTVATKINKMNITLTTADTATPPNITDRPDTIFPITGATPVDWRDLRGVTVKITAPNPDTNADLMAADKRNIDASGRFYPRNILSTNAQ